MTVIRSASEYVSDPARLSDLLIDNLSSCDGFWFSSAWATHRFPFYKNFIRYRSKIQCGVVGLHFYQTSPSFIDQFNPQKAIRFHKATDGVFHPKVYVFKSGNRYTSIIGSANLTQGGFENNTEACIVDRSKEIAESIIEDIGKWYLESDHLTVDEIDSYKEQYDRRKKERKSLSGKYETDSDEEANVPTRKPRKARVLLDVPVLNMSWNEFVAKVKNERQHKYTERLDVLKACRSYFTRHQHLKDMSYLVRQNIAGLRNDEHADFLWFGSMKGNGYFKSVIKENSKAVSAALDAIPLSRSINIERSHFIEFVNKYSSAFKLDRNNLGTASRLLAMKRPDVFCCLNTKNKILLCKSFGIGQKLDYEGYWDSIIARLQDSNWYNSPRPSSRIGGEIWDGRCALLDSLFFRWK